MYCKHCGNQIADDSVFCAKCGKLVVEATSTSQTEQSYSSPRTGPQWWVTDTLQWKKPTVARFVQIIIIVTLGLFSLYILWCFLSGGETQLGVLNNNGRYIVYVDDPLDIGIIDFTSVEYDYYGTYCGYDYVQAKSKAKGIFRWRMFLVLLPLGILIWLTIRWMMHTRFPGVKDIVPRDVADEIEQYDWNGFTRYKYVFYKKDGKYGIIDARNYCVNVPAQFDSIVWRMPNKIYDVTIGEQKKTFNINNHKKS